MATTTPSDKAWEVIRAYEKKMEAGGLADPYPTHLVLKDYFEKSLKNRSQLEGSHHYCPNCLVKIDGVSSLEGKDHTPGEGDISICIFCSRLLTWRDDRWFGLSMETFQTFPEQQKNELVRTILTFSVTDRPGPTEGHAT